MAKYIKTKDDEIIIFSDTHMHSDFKHLKPISAGFIEFYIINDFVKCRCDGESISLNLKSDIQRDTFLANNQILNILHY